MLTTGQCQSLEGVSSGETSCRGGTLKNEALALEGSVSVSDEVFPSRQGSTDVGAMASASPIPTSACLCSSHRTSTSGLTLPSDKQDCQTSESQQQEFFDEGILCIGYRLLAILVATDYIVLTSFESRSTVL